MTGLPPVTEEDAESVKNMIERLKRLRKREHSHENTWITDLDDAIESLVEYGEIKGWWDDNTMSKD